MSLHSSPDESEEKCNETSSTMCGHLQRNSYVISVFATYWVWWPVQVLQDQNKPHHTTCKLKFSQKENFRSYRNFHEADFVQDLHQVPFHIHVSVLFDDPATGPMRPHEGKYPYSPLFMNFQLWKAIYNKRMLYDKYNKYL